MEKTTEEILQEIRKKLRLRMDGINSSSMRQKGIRYKLNFGVPIMTLRQLAKEYAKNEALAEALWKEDIREFKILSLLLEPENSFTKANDRVKGINNIELAEQACMHLFSKMPEREKYAGQWIVSPELYIRICGFLLYARLFTQGHPLDEKEEKEEYFTAVFHAVNGESLLLKNAAVTSLKQLGRQSVLISKDILAACKTNMLLYNAELQFLYEELEGDFDFFYSA